MRKIDINEIRQAVKDGKLSIWVNSYGYIQLKDNETGERVCLGYMEKEDWILYTAYGMIIAENQAEVNAYGKMQNSKELVFKSWSPGGKYVLPKLWWLLAVAGCFVRQVLCKENSYKLFEKW